MANSGFSNFKDLNICFIAGTLGKGGAEKQAYYLLEHLKKGGANVVVLSLTKGEYWEEKIKALNVSVIWIGQKHSSFSRLLKIIQFLKKNKQYKVVQGFHNYVTPYVAISGKLFGRITIGAIRNEGKKEIKSLGKVHLFYSLRLIDLFAANSKMAIKRLSEKNILNGKLVYLPNVIQINQSEFGPINSPNKSGSQTVKLLTIGRLTPQKRIDRFLRIIEKLNRKGWPIKASIIGKGPEESHLKHLAEDLGIASLVSFEGVKEDVFSSFYQADVFLLTSDFEGTPNVIMEAMAAQVPIIASNVGEIGNMVKSGENGILIQSLKEEEFVNSVETLIQDEKLRRNMVNNAWHYLNKNHTEEALSQAAYSLYKCELIR